MPEITHSDTDGAAYAVEARFGCLRRPSTMEDALLSSRGDSNVRRRLSFRITANSIIDGLVTRLPESRY